MADVIYSVCDECMAEGIRRPTGPLTQFTILSGTERTNLMLCPRHKAPLEQLMSYGTTRGGQRPLVDIARMEARYIKDVSEAIAQRRTGQTPSKT